MGGDSSRDQEREKIYQVKKMAVVTVLRALVAVVTAVTVDNSIKDQLVVVPVKEVTCVILSELANAGEDDGVSETHKNQKNDALSPSGRSSGGCSGAASPYTMNMLCWNCRVLGLDSTVGGLQWLLKLYRPLLVRN
jgi:hypothetical protein